MDSMRSLNTSLPRSSPRRQMQAHPQQPPEDLLSAFKAAALSVTTLYKTAASDQARARAVGYQDALDDLLAYLDKEHVGHGEGEGRRIRKWVTERLDISHTARADSDEEEEEVVEEEKVDTSSPETSSKLTPPLVEQQQAPGTTTESMLPPPPPQPQPQQQQPYYQQESPSSFASPRSEFIFRSSQPYPTNYDREVAMEGLNAPTDATHSHGSSDTPIRVEILPRPSRSRQNRPNGNRSSARSTLGAGAGSKRKVPIGDFFDISGLSFDHKDNHDKGDRGGKRGRFV